nr:zinc-binding dehydrogenase [Ureibacillus galli]
MVVDIKNIIPIDENVSDSVAAISEALAVSYTAVKKVEHFHSKRVLVVGPGPIGLGVGAVLIGSGNEQVDMLGTTVDENRLKLAKSIGIKMTYMSEEEILTKDFNGYDAIIDCSGHPSVPQMAMRLLKRGGQLVLVGINSASFSIPMDQIVRGEISINGSYGITRGNYEEVLKLAAIPTYPFDKLIAEKVPFSQCTKGFEKALNKVSGKVVITM